MTAMTTRPPRRRFQLLSKQATHLRKHCDGWLQWRQVLNLGTHSLRKISQSFQTSYEVQVDRCKIYAQVLNFRKFLLRSQIWCWMHSSHQLNHLSDSSKDYEGFQFVGRECHIRGFHLFDELKAEITLRLQGNRALVEAVLGNSKKQKN